jgi:hypothetical protein
LQSSNDFIRGQCGSAGLRCELVRHGVVLSMRFKNKSRRLVRLVQRW